MRDSIVCTPVGVMVTISVVPVIKEARVSWVVCMVETEGEGGDIIVCLYPTLVTVETEVMDEVTLQIEVTGTIVVTVAIGLSILGRGVQELVRDT